MSDIDVRLHRAGRQLRDVAIEPPPLDRLGIARPAPRRRRTAPATLASLMFLLVVAAVLVDSYGTTRDGRIATAEVAAPAEPVTTIGQPAPAMSEPLATRVDTETADRSLTVHEEIVLIAALGSGRVDVSHERATSILSLTRYQ